eukprot:974419-Karenia_brevis.AAC.1
MDRTMKKGVLGLCCAWLHLGRSASHGMTPEEGREAQQDYKKHIGTSAFLEDRQKAHEYFKQLAADQG